MHNITKIKIFRILLGITWLPSLILLYPVALLRKKSRTGLFFFFDRYAMGGAQRVHLDILEAVGSLEKDLFFTRRSPDGTMKQHFEQIKHIHIHYVERFCEYFLFRLFSVHYFAFYINRHPGARVLSSNSTFFYDMLPYLRKSVFTIELLHNFSYGKNGMEYFGMMNHRYISIRTVIDEATRQNIINQYREYNIASSYDKRIKLIEFGVEIPVSLKKDFGRPLQVIYAGRGGPQKRIYLINQIAEHFLNSKESVHFNFAGTINDELSELVKQKTTFYGIISDSRQMGEIFRACHVLLMTSAYEGFPMVIKESMANGCIPVVIGLAGIRTHLNHLKNALLIDEKGNEHEIVKEGIKEIQVLLNDEQMLKDLSNACYHYALRYFNKKTFIETYYTLLSEGHFPE